MVSPSHRPEPCRSQCVKHDEKKPKLGCTPRSARWLHIWSLLSTWGAPIHAPGDFCVFQVQVDGNHEKIFFLSSLWLKLNPNTWTQEAALYLQAITWFCWNSKSVPCVDRVRLLSIYKWSHGSAKIQRMSTLRALLASQHETRSVQNSGQQRRSNSEGTPKDVSCFQGEHSTFNNHQWSSWWSQGNVTTACDQHQL